MSLGFVLGRAGSGKTRYVLDNIIDSLRTAPDGSPIILLVPEQSTFQMEYTLAANTGLEGAIRAQVLSFRRLAYRVFLETGGAVRIPIGDLGKRMLLRSILERHKEELRIFGNSASKPGFADTLARSIGELKTYLVEPETLENAAEMLGSSPVLLDKIRDIAYIYREMNTYLGSRFTDPDDYLKLLSNKIYDSQFCRNAVFYLDGFKGFTPQEFLVIEKLMQVSEVIITLCLDDKHACENLAEEDLFYPTWETFNELITFANKNDVFIKEHVTLKPEKLPRFSKSPEIAHLEKEYFNYPPAVLNTSSCKSIKLAVGAGRRAEVEGCAREILRLSREKGYRFRDIAVNLRNLDDYYELIHSVFNDYGIPHFIDSKRTVMHHPLIELIRSALEAVIKNWSYDPIIRYLKTDLVPLTREDVYLLENYVLAHGIRGSKWYDGTQWNYRRRYTLGEDKATDEKEILELTKINNLKNKAVAVLDKFCKTVNQAKNARDLTISLYNLLEELNAAETIAEWSRDCEKKGDLDEARQHSQIWTGVVNLLDEMVECLGEEEIPPDIYAKILDSGLESLTVGLIPPGLDQVLVGSLDRSRNPDTKAVFLLGVNDGVLPARPVNDSIFNDSEREKMEELGIALAPGSRKKSFEEQFLIYNALTRASEILWVSYPMADDEGRNIAPSPVIKRITQLIPSVEKIFLQIEPKSSSEDEVLEYVVTPRRSLTYLAAKMREAKAGKKVEEVWWELYDWFVDNKKDEILKIIPAIFFKNSERNISGKKSRYLFGSPIKASVSRIEKFISCPFSHFLAYGLKLQERDVFRLEAPDMGELFHAALKIIGEKLLKEGMDWGSLSRDKCAEISEKVVEELAPKLQSEILLSTPRYRYLTGKLKKIVNRAALVLAEHAANSVFRPVGFELAFGKGQTLPPVIIDLPGGEILEITGRIDRLDIAEYDGKTFIRVIDYKSGFNDINLAEIYHGIRLQLLTYLYAVLLHYSVESDKEIAPAGIMYFTVKDPVISTPGPLTFEQAHEAILKQLQMRGFVLGDKQVVKMLDSHIDTTRAELQRSKLIKGLAVKKDGTFSSSAPVLDENQFQLLCGYLKKLFLEAGTQILQGDVSINPFRYDNNTPCRFCVYKPVCKFDLLFDGNDYRILAQVSSEEIWAQIGGDG